MHTTVTQKSDRLLPVGQQRIAVVPYLETEPLRLADAKSEWTTSLVWDPKQSLPLTVAHPASPQL